MRKSMIIIMLAGTAACAQEPAPPMAGGWGGPGGHGHHGPMREGLFISPMGEPFRGEGGGEALVTRWFDGVDVDHDGRITLAEFRADARRFFKLLDTDGDGEIAPAEIEHYEEVLVPEIRVGGAMGGARPGGGGGHRGGGGGGHRGGGGGHGGGGGGFGGDEGGDEASGEHRVIDPDNVPQGAARFGLLGFPEPVVAADFDFNRGVSAAEFDTAAVQRFRMLDADHDGVLTRAELPKLRGR